MRGSALPTTAMLLVGLLATASAAQVGRHGAGLLLPSQGMLDLARCARADTLLPVPAARSWAALAALRRLGDCRSGVLSALEGSRLLTWGCPFVTTRSLAGLQPAGRAR